LIATADTADAEVVLTAGVTGSKGDAFVHLESHAIRMVSGCRIRSGKADADLNPIQVSGRFMV
jgi:hypothetical protein